MIAPRKDTCQVCNQLLRKSTSDLRICNKCIKNPYRIEDLRNILASTNNFKSLRKTYTTRLPEIENFNTRAFWDKKFKDISLLSNQDEMTKDKINQIASFLLTTSELDILDLGVGKGYLEQFISDHKKNFKNIKISAIDISYKSISDLKTLLDGSFYVNDVKNIDKVFKDKFFDFIIALELLEHISPHEILPLLAKTNKLLKRDGRLLITIPLNEHLEKLKNNPSRHVRNYTFEIIKGELELTGFRVDKAIYLTAFKNYYSFKKLAKKLFPFLWEPNSLIVLASKTKTSNLRRVQDLNL